MVERPTKRRSKGRSMTRLQKVKMAALMLCVSLTGMGCQTVGGGTKSVTCEAIKHVYLSRKDTAETIRQIVGNNGALASICGAPPPYKKIKK